MLSIPRPQRQTANRCHPVTSMLLGVTCHAHCCLVGALFRVLKPLPGLPQGAGGAAG
jgi:hypothetical protein